MKPQNLIKLLIIPLLLVSFDLAAQGPCNEQTYAGPILQNGRLKPYIVHANEIIKHLTNKTKVNKMKATQVFCQLSLSSIFKKDKI